MLGRAGERVQLEGWGNLQVLRAQKERERCAVRARSMLEREREREREEGCGHLQVLGVHRERDVLQVLESVLKRERERARGEVW